MPRILKAVFLALALAGGAAVAADKPSAAGVQPPLRVVVQVSDNDPARWNLALNNVRNIQKEVGPGQVEVELVVYGPGLPMLKDDSVVATRVQEAVAAGTKVLLCRNTMVAQKVTEAEIAPGVAYVQAGVVEIVRKQSEGWSYLRP